MPSCVLFASLALATAGGGCAGQASAPQSPAPVAAAPAIVVPSSAELLAPVIVDEAPYNMYIAEPMLLVCTGPDPFFAFDVAKPLASDKPTMNHLITCLQSAAMRGKTVKLIGHTDPRGTLAFNERLGLQRAEHVKKYLVANGIDASRVVTASMGAEDAAKAPKEWATDRRVQIQLVP